MGVYPFMFGSIKDFEPVVEGIIQVRTLRLVSWARTLCIYIAPGLDQRLTEHPTIPERSQRAIQLG